MEWTIAQIKKKIHQDPTFRGELDLTGYVPKDEDIISVDTVNVDGRMSIEGDDELFVFEMDISTVLTVACSRSLRPVDLVMDFTVREIFSYDNEDEYRQIEGISIDLSPIVWSNIYLEKPMRVIHPQAKDMDVFKEKETPRRVNPKFAELKKYRS